MFFNNRDNALDIDVLFFRKYRDRVDVSYRTDCVGYLNI